MDQFAQKYIEEATEIIAKLEQLILEVEKQPQNLDMINEIFRLMHTLKGGGAMFGFSKVTDVTHELESIYDYIRNGKAKIDNELLNISLDIVDYVKVLINPNAQIDEHEHELKVNSLTALKEKFKKNCSSKNTENSDSNSKIKDKNVKVDKDKDVSNEQKITIDESQNNKIIEDETNSIDEKQNDEIIEDEIEKLIELNNSDELIKNFNQKVENKVADKPINTIVQTPEEIKKIQNIENKKSVKTYKVFFKPHIDILKNGTDPLLLLRELYELGLSKVFTVTDTVPVLDKLTYDNTYLCWLVLLVTDNKNAIDDVFIFVEDDAFIDIEVLYEGNAFDDEDFVLNIDKFVNYQIKKYKKNCVIEEFIPSTSTKITPESNNTDAEPIKNEKKVDNLDDKNKETEQSQNVVVKDKEKILHEKILELEKVTKETQLKEKQKEHNNNNSEKNITDEKIKPENISEKVEKIDIFDEQEKEENKFIETEVEKNLNSDKLSKQVTTISSLRVSAEKVDTLMNLVSELITTQARLSVFVESNTNPELEYIAENIQKLSRQLRDNAFELSMVPLQSVVLRFQRLVRDLSAQLNKNIEFKTEGSSTELDKRIIENLIDPIMHLLRNSLDHGIEHKSTRKKLGKPERASVFLNAFYSGTNVFIQVGDDGRGINAEEIKSIAIKKGLLKPNVEYKVDEILNVIFEPGFSTSFEVSEVSGRGVGLDVVKRKVSELRGEIKVETELNFGTVFTIKLPLTLSIIDGLLVLIGNTRYVIPMSVVHKIYAIDHIDLKKSHYNLLVLDNQQVPYYYLREEFDEKSKILEKEQVLVINHEDKMVAIIVDKVIGEYQAVIKTLGKLYHDQQIFSGATILGDGTVALVMDVRKIIDKFSVIEK
ncbi:MAG: chemotaxis protein CheA [Bacteroidales bacterium]|nr:chemotaxis protein CheA [Bacteroidales bacterium]